MHRSTNHNKYSWSIDTDSIDCNLYANFWPAASFFGNRKIEEKKFFLFREKCDHTHHRPAKLDLTFARACNSHLGKLNFVLSFFGQNASCILHFIFEGEDKRRRPKSINLLFFPLFQSLLYFWSPPIFSFSGAHISNEGFWCFSISEKFQGHSNHTNKSARAHA